MGIEWNEKLATGDTEIDSQHRELFRRFDNLVMACNQRRGKEEIYSLLVFLGDYVKTHFSMEESLQKKYNYPNYQAHKDDHEGFILEFQRLEDQLRTEGAMLSLVIQTNQIMINWLIKHINGMDRDMANYIRSNR